MNQDPQVLNRKLTLATTEQVSVLASRVESLTETKQLTLMKVYLQTQKLLEGH
jgi:hypothetical protein